MNKLFLGTGAALLAVSLSLSAQTASGTASKSPYEKTGSPAAVTKTATGGGRDLSVNAGTLQQVVEELEAHYARNKGKADAEDMPPLVWSQDTLGLRVPVPLRLGEVKWADALALIGASAGCRLEPILSPQPDSKGGRIIGYKFVRQDTRGMMGGYSAFDSLAASKPVPSSPGMSAAADSPGRGRSASVSPYASGPITSTTVTAITSTPAGTVKEIQEELIRHELTLGDGHPRLVELKRQLEAARKASEEVPITRIYAMGGIISGEPAQLDERLQAVKSTLLSVIAQAGLKEKDVQLSFHSGTNIMVIRAPEAAQKLVEQLFAALRENSSPVRSKPLNPLN